MRSFMSLFVSSVFVTFVSSFLALDTVTPHQLIKDGDKLVSAGGTFELGFFSPGNSKYRYLGIWYVASPGTVVWVANREDPIRDGSGVLKITGGGVLNLVNITDSTVWSSNASATAEDAFAQLLDSGNLVVRDSNGRNQESYLWQSFDYPCDTFLQRMKVGKNLVTGLETFLSSWKSAEDPAPGEYSLHLDTHGFPQMVIRKGSSVVSRFGPLNVPTVTADPMGQYSSSKYQFTYNESEIYVEYKHTNSSVLSRYALNPSGTFQHFTWVDRIQNWVIYSTAQADQCQNYAWCGAYGSCNSNKSPVCECLKGFNPKSPKVWSNGIWFDGCERRTELNCHDDGFLKYLGVKLPDTSSSLFNETMDLKECGQLCLKNCSCTAYANLYIEGIGCLLWFVNLIDISELSKGGQDLYVRVAASELGHVEDNNHGNISKTKLIGIAVGSTTFIVVIIMFGLTIFVRKKKLKESGMIKIFYWSHHNHKSRKEDLDLPTFDLPVIAKATDNFSGTNKLGEGGFGPVYKGTLTDGQELAVKRLSKNSGQGLEEFKNEVALIAKLQHRNLVKLLGYCIHGEEKMLIYEYMPNKSLDYFIFDENRSKLLDWCKRFHVIGGIARGLVYLHQDSRLRIIHRDLKTSNILLDENMNPKISDFGLARTFWGDQVEANTNKVAGTYGYMPPEYAVHGHFSMKSDVFSFGVVVLEIVSGKKNRGFSDPEHYLNLLGHAWRLWTDGRPLELMNTFLGERCTPSEVIRCIHVGLLCVQQRPEDRPDMTAVILMLNGEKSLPRPKVPGFYTGRDIPEADSLSAKFRLFSKNDISLTVLEAR